MLFNLSKWRCAVAAAVGAAYSVAHFFLGLPLPLHIVTAVVMVLFVTCKKQITSLAASVVVFLCSEVFVGGCVTALHELSRVFSKSSLILAAFIILLSVVGSSVFSAVQFVLKKRLEVLSLKATLWHRGKSSALLLMVDSGNLVREFETKRRVIFVRAESIKSCIGDAETLFEREKCYVIPIDTPSGKGSVMGFIPDKMEFSDKKYNDEEFIVVPDLRGGKYGGYDGIAPLI